MQNLKLTSSLFLMLLLVVVAGCSDTDVPDSSVEEQETAAPEQEEVPARTGTDTPTCAKLTAASGSLAFTPEDAASIFGGEWVDEEPDPWKIVAGYACPIKLQSYQGTSIKGRIEIREIASYLFSTYVNDPYISPKEERFISGLADKAYFIPNDTTDESRGSSIVLQKGEKYYEIGCEKSRPTYCTKEEHKQIAQLLVPRLL